MTQEEIEAEWWAYHYQENGTVEEYSDDDENAAEDYLAQITREAEALEAAGRDATISPSDVDPATVDDWEEV